MTTSRLGPLGAGTFALAASAALIFSGSAAATAATLPPTAALDYVALGDSYAAGFGVLPSTELPVPGCDQAVENYPHQVAAALGMVLTDATCTGAVTANIIGTSQVTPTYFGGGTANPQASVLSAETDVVTVSIGGNDAGFSFIAESCLAGSGTMGPVLGPDPSDPFQYATCEEAFAQASPPIDLAANVTGVVAGNLAHAYAAIRAAAPNAKVFVVGYPSIFPDAANTPAGGCFTTALPNGFDPPYASNSVPFTDDDVPFIHSIEVLLNQVIAEQSAAAGFTFIDNQPGSLAHSVCPQDAEPYINGVTIRTLDTSNPPLTEPGALHPNPAGVAYLTAQVAPVISAAFPVVVPTASPSPTPAALPTSGPSLAESGGSLSTSLLGFGAVFAVAAAVLLTVTARRSRRPSVD